MILAGAVRPVRTELGKGLERNGDAALSLPGPFKGSQIGSRGPEGQQETGSSLHGAGR